jgi:predicted transcriptional regulator
MLALRLSDDTATELARIAEAEDRPVAQVVRQAVNQLIAARSAGK